MIARALEGQRAWTGSNLQDRLNDVWDPFATEGMFTGSLPGGRVYLRLAFLIPRQGGAGAVPPPPLDAYTGSCYLQSEPKDHV